MFVRLFFLCGFLLLLACSTAPEKCPSISVGGDNSACCEELGKCCVFLEGKDKKDCEQSVREGAVSSCQASHQQWKSRGLCKEKK